VRLCRLEILFVLEKDGAPTGILPLAFSDMPLNCRGTVSSAEDDTDAARELLTDCVVALDVRIDGDIGVAASLSESSSSPIVNALCSSGTLLKLGARVLIGLLMLSIEFVR
jgi:hypothetical protein